MATMGTAVAVVGTGTVVGGGTAIDNMRGGPEKREGARVTEIRKIVQEEVANALIQAWPTTSGPVKGTPAPTQNYRKQVPLENGN